MREAIKEQLNKYRSGGAAKLAKGRQIPKSGPGKHGSRGGREKSVYTTDVYFETVFRENTLNFRGSLRSPASFQSFPFLLSLDKYKKISWLPFGLFLFFFPWTNMKKFRGSLRSPERDFGWEGEGY